MLSKQRCPHTGIVNYFARTEPFFAVGSITEANHNTGSYYWRVYNAAKTISGIAEDMKSAEQKLVSEYRDQRRTAGVSIASPFARQER